MPAPIPEPGPDDQQPPGGEPGAWWGGAGWWADGSADTGPAPGCGRPGPQPGSRDADGLDYAALLDALAAAGALGGDDQDAEFAEWQAAEAEGRLLPADPAAVAAQAVEHMAPGAAQAGWLEVAAGGMGRLDEYGLVGVTLAAHQQEARAAATQLSAIARLCAATALADPKIGLRPDGRPARVSRDALGQIENALLLTHYQAEDLADLAVTLAWRLPGTGRALAAGAIDLDRAKLIAQATSVLTEQQARAVEAKILPKAGGLARPDLRDRPARAVINADPGGAERRREQAERQAKVSLCGDPDGTATLVGSSLPAVHAAAAMARITAIARAMKAAGQAGGLNLHRAQVMIGLILGTLPPIPPAEGAPPDQPPPHYDDPGPGRCPGNDGPGGDPGHGNPGDPGHGACVGPAGNSRPGQASPGPGPGPGYGAGGGRGPADNSDAGRHADTGAGPAGSGSRDHGGGGRDGDDPHGRGPDDRGQHDGGPDNGDQHDSSPDNGSQHDSGADGGGLDERGPWEVLPAPRDEDAPPDDGLDDDGPGPQDESWDRAEDDDDLYGTAPVPAWPGLGAIPPAFARRPAGPPDGLLDATVPWTTLAGLTDRPGTLGRVGPVTAAQARLLAQAAQADPAAQWRVIVTNAAGQAIAVTRIPRPRHRGRDGPGPAREPPPGAGLVGRITVTITQDTLATAGQGSSPGPGPPGGGIAAAALRAAARALARAQDLASQDAAAGGCAHADQAPGYRPPPRLREFVIARDVTCRSHVCRQPAWRANLDHTRPYDQHGPTCSCNLGGRCRRDHILKQHPRWGFSQDGGEFTWTAPSGRTYTVGPDAYPV